MHEGNTVIRRFRMHPLVTNAALALAATALFTIGGTETASAGRCTYTAVDSEGNIGPAATGRGPRGCKRAKRRCERRAPRGYTCQKGSGRSWRCTYIAWDSNKGRNLSASATGRGPRGCKRAKRRCNRRLRSEFGGDVPAGISCRNASSLASSIKSDLRHRKREHRSRSTVCRNAVQGKIAWNYEGNKSWAPRNIRRLCKGAHNSTGPARCFRRVMHGGVNWGGGTHWKWQNAIDLCEGTHRPWRTIRCFKRQIRSGKSWREAIRHCETR